MADEAAASCSLQEWFSLLVFVFINIFYCVCHCIRSRACHMPIFHTQVESQIMGM